jgi:dipeptidyl-peptidase-4
MKRLLVLVCAGASLWLGGFTMAETAAPLSVLTPERVFGDPDLSGPLARGVALSPDGKLVTFLRAKPTDQSALDLWAAPAAGQGPAHLLVDAAALEAQAGELTEAEKARRERQRIHEHGVVEYSWDDQGKTLLVPVSGEIYLADPVTGAVTRRIAKGKDGADATDARISPKGGYLSFVRGGALIVATVKEGAERAISPAAHGEVSYAVAEFVAQEEMGRDTGYWWSPDEKAIAYTRVDETGVDVVPRLDIGANGSTVVSQRYPRAGRPNAKVALFVQRLEGGEPIQVDLGSNEDIYLARVNWSVDGKTLYVQRESRDQQTLDLIAVDPATGKGHILITESRKPWINIYSDFKPLKDGGFIWPSERTGYMHLYLYNAAGKLVRPITSGAFALSSHERDRALAGVDEEQGLAYIVAGKDTPLERQLYVVDYRHGGEMKRITTGDGWWRVVMSRKANAFVGTFSNPSTPPNTGIYGLDGQRRSWIVENRLDQSHPYATYLANLPKPEFGTLKAEDGQTLHYVMLKPVGFDPNKHYPAIVQVYGGPGVQLVTRGWRAPAERLFLEAGFVVFQLDNRGSYGRGLAFEAPISRNMGTPEVHDQIVGLRFLQSQPFVDPKRVGVTGWSYGGYMTLRLLTEPGAGFAAGASGGPPSDWRLYDTHYTERYMGMPQTEAAAYDASAVLPRLKDLKGRLLLMHGMADDNVVFENSTRIMADLQSLGTPFDLMLYPGQRHGVSGANRKIQQWRTWLAFFQRELGTPQ